MANDISGLTPQEQAELEQKVMADPSWIQPTPPTGIPPEGAAQTPNVFKDLTPEEIAELSVKNPDFDPATEFANNPDLAADPVATERAIQAHDLLTKRGFKLSDIRPGKAISNVVGGAYRGGRRLVEENPELLGGPLGVPVALGKAAVDIVQAGRGDEEATKRTRERERQLVEMGAGVEAGTFGFVEGAKKIAGKVGRKALDLFGLGEEDTPEKRSRDFWDAVGMVQQQQNITKGKGGLIGAISGETQRELEQSGLPVRPEAVGDYAGVDPFSFMLWGKALKPVMGSIPAVGRGLAQKAGEKLVPVAGATVEAAGKAAEIGGRTAAAVAPVAAPIVGAVKGGTLFGPGGVVGGIAAGGIAGQAIKRAGQRVAGVGERIAQAGREAVAEGPRGAGGQLIRDVAQTAPVAAAATAEGIGFDVALAGLTSDRPVETANASAFGTLFGLGRGALQSSRHIVSGQIVSPRAWGANRDVPASGVFPTLDAMHAAATPSLTPGEQVRLNALRAMARRMGTELYFGTEEQVGQALSDLGQGTVGATAAGFFTGSLRGADGQPRRVIVVTEVGAAPHEARHAIENIIGEAGMREVDKMVQDAYRPQWEQLGQQYVQQLLAPEVRAGRISPEAAAQLASNWRRTVSEASGWVNAEVLEHMIRSTEAANGGAPLDAETRQAIAQEWDNIRQRGGSWRDVITDPAQQEQLLQQVGDRYLAREVAAENFDAALKNMGPALERKDLPGKLAWLVANTMRAFGVDPVQGRVSEDLGTPLNLDVMKQTIEQGRQVAPLVQPREAPAERPTVAPAPRPLPPTATPQEQAAQAEEWVNANPTPIATREKAARTLNEALSNGQGVRVEYFAAKGEPGGDPSIDRPERRAVIEAARDLPNKVRQPMAKDIFPFRQVMTSKGPQWIGWSPNNFNANVARLAEFVQKLNPTQLAELRAAGLEHDITTPAGLQALQNDVNAFVQNQLSGFTGSGRELVVPAGVEAAGFEKPAVAGAPLGLPQGRADVINYLFASKLPGKAGDAAVQARRGEKGLPLNVAGAEIAQATAPGEGRVMPVEPRRTFEGAVAEEQGVAGLEVREVNPFRSAVEAAAKVTGAPAPKLIEATQRLNFDRLIDATIEPALTKFGANTLTLQAGFKPKSADEYRRLAETADPAQWREEMTAYRGQYGGGLTGAAYDLGAQTRSPEQLAQLIEGKSFFERQGRQAMADGKFNEAMQAGNRSQFFREALEAATGGTSAEFIKNHYDPNYVAPMEGVQFKPRTDSGQRLEKDGYTFRHVGGPLGRQVTLAKDGMAIAEITSTTPPRSAMDATPGVEAMGERLSNGKVAHLDFVEVNPEFRGKGLGEALYRELLSQLQADGVTHLTGMVVRPEPLALREKVSPGATDYFVDGEPVTVKEALQAAEEYAKGGRLPDGTWDIRAIEPFTRIEEGRQYKPSDRRRKGYVATERWLGKGKLEEAPDGHEQWAVDKFGGEHSGGAEETFDVRMMNYERAENAGYLRVSDLPQTIEVDSTSRFPTWDSIPRTSRQALEDLAFESGKPVHFDGKPVIEPPGEALEGQFKPGITDAEFEKKMKRIEDAALRKAKAGRAARPAGNYKLPKGASGGFKKAWILPNGEPLQLGGEWHHQGLAERPELQERYGLEIPPFEGTDVEGVREMAMQKGFVRVNYSVNTGKLSVEARKKDWTSKMQDSVRRFVEENNDAIDSMDVTLYNDRVNKIVDEDSAQLFRLRGAEKLANLPLIAQLKPKKRYEGLSEDERDELDLREAYSYFSKGHGEQSEADVVWMWDRGNRSLKEGPGSSTHGSLWTHEVADRTFKGRYDADSDSVTVIFPENELRKLGRDWAEVDDLPQGVYASLSRRFGTEKFDVYPKSRESIEQLESQYKPFSDPAFEKEVEKIKSGETFGQTFAADGTVWEPANKKQDLVSLASVNIPREEVSTDSVMGAISSYRELLDEPNVVVGLFSFKKDGKDMVSVDLNAVVPSKYRENTKAFAKDNDQVSIWDVEKGEEIKTGGGGDTKLSKLQEILDALDLLSEGQPVDVEEIQSEYSRGDLAEQQALAGFEGVREYDPAQIAKMSRQELRDYFPEAVVPRRVSREDAEGNISRQEPVLTSDVTESPLYKQAKNEAEAVKLFADKFARYVEPWKDSKAFKDGSRWYAEFTPRLKKAFGEWAQQFAELLAASSPQTGPELNFRYAHDAVRSWQDGRFDKIISKFNEGLEKVADGSWETWLDRSVKSGKASEATKAQKARTAATFLAEWIRQHDLKPKQTNGKLYGQHSEALLQVFARKWLEQTAGPKTQNFVQNLLGTGHGATVDLWADRTMRRLGYEGFEQRWRILPKNQGGVRDVDFAFAQKVFEAAAKKLGMKADDLQGAAWFIEKVDWARNGWGRLDLGDYRKELDKLPLLEQGYRYRASRIAKPSKRAKKEATQEDLFGGLVQPK